MLSIVNDQVGWGTGACKQQQVRSEYDTPIALTTKHNRRFEIDIDPC